MEENQESKTLTQKVREREEQEKLAKRKVLKKIFIVVLILLLIDQITKFIFINKDIALIPGVLKFHTVQNRGGAFGIGQNSTFTFIVVNIIVLGIIIKFINMQANQIDRKTGIALAMVLAGGFGNLIDRIFRGFVVDFIDVSELINFPNFNFADIFIVLGPSGHKLAHIKIGVGLQRAPEVVTDGVLVLILLEIIVNTAEELRLAEQADEHEDEAGALGINDGAVEESGNLGGGVDGLMDGLDAWEAVAFQGSETVASEEVLPDIELGIEGVGGEVFNHAGEGFVEPEVVPPSHGDEVAEPLVREFVGDGEGNAVFGVKGGGLVG